MRSTEFYFDAFEHRQPPEPVPHSVARELLWQFLAVVSLALGANYLVWRWTSSLNPDAMWFAVPMVVAETLAYVGLILFTINLWRTTDEPITAPPATTAEAGHGAEGARPLRVDVFFPTYDEDPELVRLGLVDAKRITYPHEIDIRIHVLDDGQRPAMAQVANEEGVHYLTREGNAGYKAGNIRHAMQVTSGDFIVICDADTRVFPTILERTLGYFRDPKVAWVQTPQWFFDLPAGRPLDDALARVAGRPGRWLGKGIQSVVGELRVGEDPFVNDPALFYDVIQRRRNWANASFCCGAGSIHRREAVMEAALRAFARTLEGDVHRRASQGARRLGEKAVDDSLRTALRQHAALTHELQPYKFHVSEDIFTSILLHSDRGRGWRSIQHPFIESKMLSPQDLLSWTVQRFKYAAGSLDICFHHGPLWKPGLTVPQRLMYGATFYSYLGGLWNTVFLLAPIVYFLTAQAPVAAYSSTFFAHLLPFLICQEIAMMVGTWGIASYRPKAAYLGFFAINLQAMWKVARGHEIKFKVTPKTRQDGRFLFLVWPHIAIAGLTIGGITLATLSLLTGSDAYSTEAVIANACWAVNNLVAMGLMISAACYGGPDASTNDTPDVVPTPAPGAVR